MSITVDLPGTIPNPIPKKFIKKASGGQPLTKEETTGFADTSAPSNSSYQTQLSPTQTAKKPEGKKMKKLKEYYNRKIIETAQGENPETYRFNEQVISSLAQLEPILEAYKPSSRHLAATKYLVQPKLSKTLRDRLAARKAAPQKSKGYVASAATLRRGEIARAQMSHMKKTASPKGYPEETKALGDVTDKMGHKKPPVVKEGLLPSPKQEYKHHLKQMRISSKLSSGALANSPEGHYHRAAVSAHLSMMQHLRNVHGDKILPKNESVVNEISTRLAIKYADKAANDKKKDRTKGMTNAYRKVQGRHTNVPTTESVGTGNFSTMTRDFPLKSEAKKKPDYSARVQGKAMASLSAKPMMGSANDNRVSEQYSKDAVDKEIRKDKRIGGKEAKRIHAFLKGRTVSKNWIDNSKKLPIGPKGMVTTSTVDGKTTKVVNELSVNTLHKYMGKRLNGRMDNKSSEKKANIVKGVERADSKIYKKMDRERTMSNEEFLADAKKPISDMKRKYLGVSRGRTATGKSAHKIEMDPVIKTDTQLNKIVK